MTSFPCESGCGLLRFGLLLTALLLPGTASAVAESVTSVGSETGFACEVVTECMTPAENQRLRKRRTCQPCWCRRTHSHAERTIMYAWQVDAHCVGKHRIRNKMLAPMRC